MGLFLPVGVGRIPGVRHWTRWLGPRPRIASFYVWHLADAVPLVDVTRTLKWSEPLAYNDYRMGGLALCYQLLVILPLVAAFGSFWSFSRSQDDQTSPTIPRREPDRDASA